jgi:hypothetical protein
MNSVLSLMNKHANGGDLYLEAGVHNLPFNVILSPFLPTSIEHEYGHIRYSIEATIDIPWFLFDIKLNFGYLIVI